MAVTNLHVCPLIPEMGEHGLQPVRRLVLEYGFYLSQNSLLLVPLRRENELALLVYSAGKFESCFEKWLFLKMKMLIVFVVELTLDDVCSCRGTVVGKTQNSGICCRKCKLVCVCAGSGVVKERRGSTNVPP